MGILKGTLVCLPQRVSVWLVVKIRLKFQRENRSRWRIRVIIIMKGYVTLKFNFRVKV